MQRQLQRRNGQNICIKLKLITSVPSALLLSLFRAYRRASARSHLTVLADFLSPLSSPAASVVSRLSCQTHSEIWQLATCTACDIKMHMLLPSILQNLNQSDMPDLNPQGPKHHDTLEPHLCRAKLLQKQLFL